MVSILTELVPMSRAMRICLSCGSEYGRARPFITVERNEHRQISSLCNLGSEAVVSRPITLIACLTAAYVAFWDGFQYTVVEWRACETNLLVIVAHCRPEAYDIFTALVADDPSMALYPLAFILIASFERLEAIASEVIKERFINEQVEIDLEPHAQVDAIREVNARVESLIWLQGLSNSLDQAVNQIEQCVEVLREREFWKAAAGLFHNTMCLDTRHLRDMRAEVDGRTKQALHLAQVKLSLVRNAF